MSFLFKEEIKATCMYSMESKKNPTYCSTLNLKTVKFNFNFLTVKVAGPVASKIS